MGFGNHKVAATSRPAANAAAEAAEGLQVHQAGTIVAQPVLGGQLVSGRPLSLPRTSAIRLSGKVSQFAGDDRGGLDRPAVNVGAGRIASLPQCVWPAGQVIAESTDRTASARTRRGHRWRVARRADRVERGAKRLAGRQSS